jgi:hypothetical protein
MREGVVGALAMLTVLLTLTVPAAAQNSECKLGVDDHNPSEHILRCGDDLVVRAAPGTRYHPVDQQGTAPPAALQLDGGALIIEFHPSDARKKFQILTPHAIAAVRGTKWAVEARSTRTSVLVISGKVAVAHLNTEPTVVLESGEGADISSGGGRIVTKRWPKKRVRALLARFGE